MQIAEAAVVATLAQLAFLAVLQPSLAFDGERFHAVNVPTSVLALYGLLMLGFIGASRYVVHALDERRLRGR